MQAGPKVDPTPLLEVASVETRVTETNNVWWRIAWRLTVRSHANRPLQLIAKIEYLDAQGFVVDQQVEHGLILPAGANETFTGFSLVNAQVAGSLHSVSAKVNAT